MDNITEYMMRQLLDVGFTYPDYEHHLNFGMVFVHRGEPYYIGGGENGDFSEADRQAAAEGLWLPDSDQLLQWLKGCGFTAAIQLDADGYFHVIATDPLDGSQYHGGGAPLSYALHKVIYKICKSGINHTPQPTLRLDVIPDENESLSI